MKMAARQESLCYSCTAGEPMILPVQILLTAGFSLCDYLRKGVSSIGSCSSEGSEKSSSASCFNRVDHSLLRLTQMRSLSEGADEHKHVIHPWVQDRQQKRRLKFHIIVNIQQKGFFLS